MECKDHQIILALGSNFEQERNMEKAMQCLRSLFPDIRFSRILWTEPIGMVSDRFVNALAVAHSELPMEELEARLKDIEKACGRCQEEKERGIIRMDIDLMQYGEEKLHLKDWSRDYVLTLLECLRTSVE